jgi:hypothetical protein
VSIASKASRSYTICYTQGWKSRHFKIRIVGLQHIRVVSFSTKHSTWCNAPLFRSCPRQTRRNSLVMIVSQHSVVVNSPNINNNIKLGKNLKRSRERTTLALRYSGSDVTSRRPWPRRPGMFQSAFNDLEETRSSRLDFLHDGRYERR